MTTRTSARRASASFAIAVAACWAAVWLQGCDGIGRELVDRQATGHTPTGCDFRELAKCDAGERELDFDGGIPLGAAPRALADCSGGWPGCSLVERDEDARDGGEPDGGEPDAATPPDDACPTQDAVSTLDHALRSCENVRVALDPDASETVAHETNLVSVSLVIASATPAEITLDRAALQQVFVRLEGPVTLRITNPITLYDVGITGIANESGAPRILLSEATTMLLAIGEPERAFPGRVDIRRSTVSDANLRADVLDLDSVRIDHSVIASGYTSAADITLTKARLDLGYATFSAAALSAVHIDRCRALVLISSGVSDSEIPACTEEPLRVYSSSVHKSSVDGLIDSDQGRWISVRFGAHAPTELLGWGTSMELVAFCDRTRHLRFGQQSNLVICSDCIDGALQEPLCSFADGDADGDGTDDSEIKTTGNLCPDLTPTGEDAPLCAGETPRRPRP